jgi:hypothetical protein
LELRTKIVGDSRTDEQKLLESPAWSRFAEALKGTLEAFPEALAAVASPAVGQSILDFPAR